MAHLIDKDALVAEIERLAQLLPKEEGLSMNLDWARNTLSCLHGFIDTLEVKEVDLDFSRFSDEMLKVASLPSSVTRNTEENPLNWEYAIAKHFFELGLKAKQG